MSINVGFINEKYNYGDLTKNTNTLVLNSYKSSNLIILNSEDNTTADTLLVYKKQFATGQVNNNFVIDDLQTNKRMASFNNSNITFNGSVSISDNISVKNMLSTSTNTISLNSNISINLQRHSDSFAINSNNNVLFKVNNTAIECLTNNFKVQNVAKTMLEIDSTNVNVNNNVRINNGTLYVNNIAGIGDSRVNISGIAYSEAQIDSFQVRKNILINQAANEQDITPFEIKKRYISTGTNPLLNIYSYVSATKNVPNMYLDKDGLLGLGTNTPDAVLSIKTMAPNIIRYTGETIGDAFNLTNTANVGIGTVTPNAQLHIRRADDKQQEAIRRTPMLHMDMMYQSSNNSSNIYTPGTMNITYSSSISVTSSKIFRKTVKTQSGSVPVQTTLDNTFYLLNQTFYDNVLAANIDNMSNIQFSKTNTIDLTVTDPRDQPSETILSNTFVYPSANVIHIIKDDALYLDRSLSTYVLTYKMILMSSNTFARGDYSTSILDSSKFIQDTTIYDETLHTISDNGNIKYTVNVKFNFWFEMNQPQQLSIKVNYPIPYNVITKTIVPAPDFMRLSYNNNFISSVSPEGTLSLGSAVPQNLSGRYTIYSMKDAYLNSIKVSQIDTERSDSNISLMNKNLISINKITCSNIDSSNIYAQNINISNATISSLNAHTGDYRNLVASNLTFHTANNDYLAFSNQNVHFHTRLSIGKPESSKELNNQSCCKITVDSDVYENNHSNIFTYRDGLLVTNMQTVNPSISVITTSSDLVPYLNLNNNDSTYFMRLKKTATVNGFTNNFQLANDNLQNRGDYFQNSATSPHILQHIKEYNVLTFGEQNNICIDTKNRESVGYQNNNKGPKISIGIPYQTLKDANSPVNNWPTVFNETIQQNEDHPYMLNIFGNVSVCDTSKSPVFTTLSEQNNIYTAINGNPDKFHTLRVFGDTATSNLTVFNDILMKISDVPNTSLITKLNQLISDVNILKLQFPSVTFPAVS
jgi:hypothetical protein